MVGNTSYGLRPPIRPPLHTTWYTTASERYQVLYRKTVANPESDESSDTNHPSQNKLKKIKTYFSPPFCKTETNIFLFSKIVFYVGNESSTPKLPSGRGSSSPGVKRSVGKWSRNPLNVTTSLVFFILCAEFNWVFCFFRELLIYLYALYLDSVYDLMYKNKLKLNPDKTEFLHIGKKCKKL